MRKWLLMGSLAGFSVLAALSAQAGEAAFCLGYEAHQCASPLKDGDKVKLDALAQNAAGERVLVFASAQPVEAGSTVYQQWESAQAVRGGHAGCQVRPWVGAPAAEAAKAALDGASLGAGPCKTGFGFTVKASGKTYHLQSQRVIYGPGAVAAQALDASGQPVAGTLVHIEILP